MYVRLCRSNMTEMNTNIAIDEELEKIHVLKIKDLHNLDSSPLEVKLHFY